MYDLIIIDGGPAGITAAAMALNQRLETLIIATGAKPQRLNIPGTALSADALRAVETR